MKIIMLGAPGAGKGTQAEKICEKYKLIHISTGDIFRENIKNNTELGKLAKGYMDAGELVPDEVVIDLVVDRITKKDCEDGFVLDGFPRTIPQAESFDEALAKSDMKIDYAINVEVADEVIINRISGRRACPKCSAIYHTEFNPPKVEGVCDNDGAEIIQRNDDKPETVLNRLKVYHEQTQPLIDYYENKDCLRTVDGSKSTSEVFDKIVNILG